MYEGKIIAFCGRICDTCPAFISKQTNDDELRKKAVREWSSENLSLELSDINCDGCTAGEVVFKYCLRCSVRICGVDKKVENCAFCEMYPCEKLKRVWNRLLFPHARSVLNEIREELSVKKSLHTEKS